MSTVLPWRLRHLLLAPHRLGFFLAMVVLWCAGLWWALALWGRVSGVPGLGYVMSPTLVHGAVMTFGFMPLYFSGFLFTAGPKWLGVEPPAAAQLRTPLGLQAGGWLLWLLGAHVHRLVGVGGVLLASVGLWWMSAVFWQLVRRSRVADQLHARVIAGACAVGCLSLTGVFASVAFDAPALALVCVLSGLWGFIVTVYVTVAHRMIPFFTASVVPHVVVWRPLGALGLMLATAALEVVAVWLDWLQPSGDGWVQTWWMLRGTLELGAGFVLLWLAGVWGLVRSFQNRLLAMLHVGFVWLGLSWVLAGCSQWASALLGMQVLPFGALHALTMGCLASLMLAMVTRVSAGHSGRPLQASGTVWWLFCLLQAVTLLRVGAAWPGVFAAWLAAIAAATWVLVMVAWGLPLVRWYGQHRPDGHRG